jgi:hypothetical protein
MKADYSKIPAPELARMLSGAKTDIAMLQNVASGLAKYHDDLVAELKVRLATEQGTAPTQPPAPNTN